MHRLLIPLITLLCIFSTAAINAQDVEKALKELPDFQTESYRVRPYLRAAAALQKLGKDKATNVLLRLARGQKHDNQIIVICRMLFKAKGQREFRRPLIGEAHFLGGTDYDNWPREPIELVDNVPFLITRGYSLKGKAEQAEAYLEYCIQHCDWNDAPFNLITEKAWKIALAKLLASPKWKTPLDDGEKRFLSSQIE